MALRTPRHPARETQPGFEGVHALCGPTAKTTALLASAALALVICSSACGQDRKPPPAASSPTADEAYVPSLTFDIAAIHESVPADSYTVSFRDPSHSSLLELKNIDLTNMLSFAYGANRAQLLGLPDWPPRTMFNIHANSESSIDDQLAKLSDTQARMEKQHMLQALLSDRFHLKVHWETREGPIYELVVARGGPKLHDAGSMPLTEDEQKNFKNSKVPVLYQRGDGRRGYEYIGHGVPMERLAATLTFHMGTPVLDKTGLTGKYDFTFRYHGATPTDQNDDPEIWPALTMALPDQLGLTLKPARGEKKFLVIDHVEKPSEN